MKTTVNPSKWDLKSLEKGWENYLESMASKGTNKLPLKRIRWQAEKDPVYAQVFGGWSNMSETERVEAWEQLTQSAEESVKEMLPVCVQCGQCCRKSGPALELEDLELLQGQQIPWNQLVTLRIGEPAHSPYNDEAFYLPEERIKIREKAGTNVCVFLDETTDTCSIYSNRPLQCRAQACWDDQQAGELADQQHLTRRVLFAELDVLLELLDEHDNRCSFDNLRNVFDKLRENKGESVAEVIDLLAYDDHFREFVAERLKIPKDNMDLVFGRKLAERVRLFGFKVETGPDGTRTLLPASTSIQ